MLLKQLMDLISDLEVYIIILVNVGIVIMIHMIILLMRTARIVELLEHLVYKRGGGPELEELQRKLRSTRRMLFGGGSSDKEDNDDGSS